MTKFEVREETHPAEPDKPIALYGDGICYDRFATRDEADIAISKYAAQDALADAAANLVDDVITTLCQIHGVEDRKARQALKEALE